MQMYLSYFEELARKSGIYDPFFGRDFFTWDNTSTPLGSPYFWGHIEIITEDGGEPNIAKWASNGQSYVILRLSPRTEIDPEDVAIGFEILMSNYTGMNQPFLAALIKWIKDTMRNQTVGWFKKDYTFQLWARNYGIDFNAIPYPVKYHDWLTTDIADWEYFCQRSTNCSPATMWALIYGWYQQQPFVRKLFLNNPQIIATMDGTAPGQIGWWLVKRGWATIVAYSIGDNNEQN